MSFLSNFQRKRNRVGLSTSRKFTRRCQAQQRFICLVDGRQNIIDRTLKEIVLRPQAPLSFRRTIHICPGNRSFHVSQTKYAMFLQENATLAGILR
jgi:hypothetical protein